MVKRQFTKYNKFMNTKPVILFIQDKRTLHVQGLIGSERSRVKQRRAKMQAEKGMVWQAAVTQQKEHLGSMAML